jgi:hypothetical protein
MNAGRLKISDDLRARAMVHCFVKKESIFCVFTLFLINQLESNGYLNWRQAALGKTRGRLKKRIEKSYEIKSEFFKYIVRVFDRHCRLIRLGFIF